MSFPIHFYLKPCFSSAKLYPPNQLLHSYSLLSTSTPKMVDSGFSDFFGPRQLEPGEDDNSASQNFVIPRSSNDETELFMSFSPEEISILLNSVVVDQTDEGFLPSEYAPLTQSAGTGTSSDHSRQPNNPPYAPPAQSATANTLVAAEGLRVLHNYSEVVDQTDEGFLPPQYAPLTQSAGTGTSSDHSRQPNNPLCASTAQSAAAANSFVAANHWSQQFHGQQFAHHQSAGTGTSSDHSRLPNNPLCAATAQSAAAANSFVAANHWSQQFHGQQFAQLCVTKPTRTTDLDAVVKRDKKRASDKRSNEKKKLKIEEMERKNGELTEEIASLNRENEDLSSKNGKLRGENERLRVENTDLNGDNESLRHQNVKLRGENGDLNCKTESLGHENVKLKGENGDLNNEIGRLKGVNERLMGDTRELNNKNESLRHENENLNREYKGSRYENSSLRDENGSLRHKNDQLNASVQNLTIQLVYQNFQLENLKLTFENAQLKHNANVPIPEYSFIPTDSCENHLRVTSPKPPFGKDTTRKRENDRIHGERKKLREMETGMKTTLTNENYESLKLENVNEIHDFWMIETKVDKDVGPLHLKLGKPNCDLELQLGLG